MRIAIYPPFGDVRFYADTNRLTIWPFSRPHILHERMLAGTFAAQEWATALSPAGWSRMLAD